MPALFRLAGQLEVLPVELFVGLFVVGILGDTVDRADLDALRLVEVTDALGAQRGVDDIDLGTLRDGAVGALGFAYIAVDAFMCDD
jgi:hypothetical protein